MGLDLLVFGDSVMWGQGLQTQDKYWSKVQSFVSANLHTNVVAHVYAHSGADIVPATTDTNAPLWGEAPVSWPSITHQVDLAQADLPTLSQEGVPCLVLVNGGINDISLSTILSVDPSIANRTAWVSKLTQQDVGPRMQQLLQHILAVFPNAFIIVTGYYPILSSDSNPTMVEVAIAALITLISPALAIYVAASLPSLISQCAAFAQQAEIGLEQAVAAVNAQNASAWNNQKRIMLATPAFGPNNAMGASESFLWLGTDDEEYAARCNWYSANPFAGAPVYTPVASLGHPNVQGASAYASAVEDVLATLLPSIPFLDAAFVLENPPPAQIAAGGTFPLSVRMENRGTIPWTAGGSHPFRLGSQNPQDNLNWGIGRIDVPATITHGQQVTFNATATAPHVPGHYNFQWQMVEEMVEWFGDTTVNAVITVTDPAPNPAGNAAALVQTAHFPTTLNTDQPFTFSVTMQNTGTTNWYPGGTFPFCLGAQNPQGNTNWTLTNIQVPSLVVPGQQVTFTVTATAPSDPGTYNFQWQMVQQGVNWFGPLTTNQAVRVKLAIPLPPTK